MGEVPGRYCGPRPTPATRLPPGSWPQLLYHFGHLDGLRARADAGDWRAARMLAELLARSGDLDRLQARVNVGDPFADRELEQLLTGLLIKQGRSDEAERLHRFGLNPDGSIARA